MIKFAVTVLLETEAEDGDGDEGGCNFTVEMMCSRTKAMCPSLTKTHHRQRGSDGGRDGI